MSDAARPRNGRPAELGRRSEDVACAALRRAGYRIVDRNFRTRGAEIDIVAEHQGFLVFIEVRARRAGGLAHPLESLTHAKRRRIILGARQYLARRGGPVPAVRFDVVTVEWCGRSQSVRILPDAFRLE